MNKEYSIVIVWIHKMANSMSGIMSSIITQVNALNARVSHYLGVLDRIPNS